LLDADSAENGINEPINMSAKVLVFGANGQVGRALINERRRDIILGFDHAAVDICDTTAVARVLRECPPVALVNAAAYTNVDRAETEPNEVMRINRDGAANLARHAASAGVPFIHISTDYIFDGSKRKPYRENDPIAPLSTYGLSKAKSEYEVRRVCPQHIILRTSWVYSPYGTNFVRTMLHLAAERSVLQVVDDQTGCPTAAADIADAIAAILAATRQPNFTDWGTYHYCGRDIVSWFGFANVIFELAGRCGQRSPQLVPISAAAYPTAARRPAYSVLATDKIEGTFGIAPRQLRESLGECMDVLFKNPHA
jgi:dTDP-4-dehydrorhamnose reductase